MNNLGTMNVLGYARVSSAGQEEHGKSLDAQDYQIRYHAAASERMWRVIHIEHEQGSGKDLGRQKLQDTLSRLAAGQADGLIVTRLDRLTRSLTDFCQLVDWFQAANKTLVILDFDLDTSTPAGELIAHMMAALAQWQRRVTAENTRNALQEKRRRGEPINQGAVSDHPDLVSEIRNQHASGSSYQQICDYFNAQNIPTIRGGTTWRPSAIGAALGVKRRSKRYKTTLPSV